MPLLLQEILLFCSAWIIVIPLLLSIIYFKKFNAAFKVLTVHLLIAFGVELSSFLLMKQKIHNLPLLHFYTVSEFILIYLFYKKFWQRSFNNKVLNCIATAFVIFSLVNSLAIQSIYTFNTYARALEALLLIIFSLLTFYKLFLAQESGDAFRGVPWVAAGFLIYFAGAFLLFVLSNYIIDIDSKLNWQIWAVHSGLSIQLYVLIAAGIWKQTR